MPAPKHPCCTAAFQTWRPTTLKKCKAFNPKALILFGGMCAGGVIAFEVAQQLQQQGESVAVVALIDAADVAAPKRIGRIANQRLQRFSSSLSQEQQLSLPQQVGTIVAKASRKLTNLAIYETQSRFTKLYKALQLRLIPVLSRSGLAAACLPTKPFRSASL